MKQRSEPDLPSGGQAKDLSLSAGHAEPIGALLNDYSWAPRMAALGRKRKQLNRVAKQSLDNSDD